MIKKKIKEIFKLMSILLLIITLESDCECKCSLKGHPFVLEKSKSDESEFLVSFNSQTGLVSASNTEIIIWNTTEDGSLRNITTLKSSGKISSIIVTNDDTRLLTGLKNGIVSIWSIVDKKFIVDLHSKKYPIRTLAEISGDMVAGGSYKVIFIWNINDGSLINKIDEADTVQSLLFYKDISLLVSTTSKKIQIINMKQDLNLKPDTEILDSSVNNHLIKSTDSQLICSSNNEITFWNINTRQVEKRLSIANKVGEFQLLTLLSENMLASSSLRQVIVWNITNKSTLIEIDAKEIVKSIATLSNNRLAVGVNDFIKVYSLDQIECPQSVAMQNRSIKYKHTTDVTTGGFNFGIKG